MPLTIFPYNLLGLLVFAIIAYLLIGMVEDAKAQKLFKVVTFIIILICLLVIVLTGLDLPRIR